jgi:cyanophycinase
MARSGKNKGNLIIIGGHENKDGQADILEKVKGYANRGKNCLVIVTVATQTPGEMAAEYTKVFKDLGVRNVDVLDVHTRDDAYADEAVEKIMKASVVFFTGGDQLRLTSQIGDTPVFRCMRDLYRDGATIVGTSAGAAALPETMLISGPSDESYDAFALGMAPGLGLIHDVVIDTHFAERGRIGRLLAAVSQNPRILGIGIDEDTAVIVEGDEAFSVIGSGAVYVLDGRKITYSSLSEEETEGILSMHNVLLHVLSDGSKFDLITRNPVDPEPNEARAKSA